MSQRGSKISQKSVTYYLNGPLKYHITVDLWNGLTQRSQKIEFFQQSIANLHTWSELKLQMQRSQSNSYRDGLSRQIQR